MFFLINFLTIDVNDNEKIHINGYAASESAIINRICFQVPRKSPHIREIRERKKHSAVMGTQIAQITQIFMLLAAQLGVSALPWVRDAEGYKKEAEP